MRVPWLKFGTNNFHFRKKNLTAEKNEIFKPFYLNNKKLITCFLEFIKEHKYMYKTLNSLYEFEKKIIFID